MSVCGLAFMPCLSLSGVKRSAHVHRQDIHSLLDLILSTSLSLALSASSGFLTKDLGLLAGRNEFNSIEALRIIFEILNGGIL